MHDTGVAARYSTYCLLYVMQNLLKAYTWLVCCNKLQCPHAAEQAGQAHHADYYRTWCVQHYLVYYVQ